MIEKVTISVSGDKAGEELQRQLENVDRDLSDLTEGEIHLTFDDENSNDLKPVPSTPERAETEEGRDPEKANMEVPCMGRGTKELEFLQVVAENPGITADGIEERTDWNAATGTLRSVWDKAVVDRWKQPGTTKYQYEITEKGKQELAAHGITD